ncbi:MAG: ATP synthase F1 subunit gamma [Muribaculaceae bacterium]|nr:ATP synthase F1 subunit gamma [Muribaculaceae bacterium]
MATLRELKGRISSVGSSEKITGAMKMISSAKMHKAEGLLRQLVPYRSQVQSIIGHLLSADAEYTSPLTESRDVKIATVVVFGSDDGLCGAYNIQIFKFFIEHILQMRKKYGQEIKIKVYPVGKKISKAISKIKDSNIEIAPDCMLHTRSTLSDIKEFTDTLKSEYISGTTDLVEVVYSHFKSVSRQELTSEAIMPVAQDALFDNSQKQESNKPYLFEPDANIIFNTVLPLFVLSSMQEVAAENNASEQAARVMAMQSANDNAKKLLDELQIVYNKLRQQSITTELLDILGGQTER